VALDVATDSITDAALQMATGPTMEQILRLGQPTARASLHAAVAAGSPLFLDPFGFDFGSVQVGTSAPSQTATLVNISGAPLTISGAGGAVQAPFRVSQSCQGLTLQPGGACTMTFAFDPTAPGAQSDTSRITWNGVPFRIELKGHGRLPDLVMTPSTHDFGPVLLGSTITTSSTIKNVGMSPVVMSGAGGAVGAPFNASQSCQGRTLQPGEICDMTFRYTPTSEAGQSDTSRITWNGTRFNIELKGRGVRPDLRTAGTAFDFGNVPVGGVGATFVVDIVNHEAAPVVMSGAGGAVQAPFNASQTCQGQTLQTGQSCTMTFRFAPTALGARADTSRITWNGVPFHFGLKGVGGFSLNPRKLIMNPHGFDFGPTQVGDTTTYVSTLTNVSAAPITMSGAGGAVQSPFGASQTCQGKTLQPLEACTMAFQYAPTTLGPQGDTSRITWNGERFDIELLGGGELPRIRASGGGAGFGVVPVGGAAPRQTIDVTNVGSAPVVMSGAGGAVQAPFNASQSCQSKTLAPGASCTMSFDFAPTTAGLMTDTSRITWNGVRFGFLLSGTGDAHAIHLNPTGHDFGPTPVGAPAQRISRLVNLGTGPVTMSGAGGAVPAPFRASQNCQGQTLAPGEECQMTFQYTPTALTSDSSASRIQWNGTAHRIELRGEGGGGGGDVLGPLVEGIFVLPDPVGPGAPVVVESVVDDSTTGGALIQMIEYQVDNGPWVSMPANDGAYDSITEEGRDVLQAPTVPGPHTLCIRGTDVLGNVGPVSCKDFMVAGGVGNPMVSGLGSIPSAAGALRPDPTVGGPAAFEFRANLNTRGRIRGRFVFEFDAGNMTLRSSSLTALTAYPDGSAVLEGRGRINRSVSPNGQDFFFKVWFTDTSPDSLRLQIYYDTTTAGLVYDTDAEEPLISGDLVVHP